MNNDRLIKISVGESRKSITWKTQVLHWSDFVNRLSQITRTNETYKEFLLLPKSKQDELKDVGGFIGGTLKDNRRKAQNIIDRSFISLDADNIASGETQNIISRVDGLGCAYVIYSTRKHCSAKPRLRIIIPLNEDCTAEEYEPIARMIASKIGLEIMDKTTFEASRLMYWPSSSVDGEFVFTYSDKNFVSKDGILSMYKNWKDTNEWPRIENEIEIVKSEIKKQKDPLEKQNIVGAFCRVYDIYSVIDKYLSDVYESGIDKNKYTYIQGSVANGAVVYDDGLYMYSYHATDPASRKLCNSFDLVRIHKFLELDDNAKEDTPANRMPSFIAMCELAMKDSDVVLELEKQKLKNAQLEFKDDDSQVENAEWRVKKLKRTSQGLIEKTISNAFIILQNDINLKDKMVFDRFSNRFLVNAKLPWDREKTNYPRLWTDSDDSELRNYYEITYDNFKGKSIIDDALLMLKNRNSTNLVKDYFNGLIWDGIPRLDNLLIDYLGAEDNMYSKEIIRKALVAATARAMTERPIKFDNMVILIGPQGVGKSTFLSRIGKNWFSDNIVDFNNKDTLLLIQNCLLVEVAELQGFRKSDSNSLKMFLGQTTDRFRAPYERREEEHIRHCVFFGTTNDQEFLKDSTGNRRYWPVAVGINNPKKNIFTELEKEVDQIWAEAKYYFEKGESLYLTGEVAEEAITQQKLRMEKDPWESTIVDYLNTEIREDWFINGANAIGKLVTRDRISIAEILNIVLMIEPKNQDTRTRKRVLDIMRNLNGWEYKDNVRFGKKVSSGFIKRVT